MEVSFSEELTSKDVRLPRQTSARTLCLPLISLTNQMGRSTVFTGPVDGKGIGCTVVEVEEQDRRHRGGDRVL